MGLRSAPALLIQTLFTVNFNLDRRLKGMTGYLLQE